MEVVPPRPLSKASNNIEQQLHSVGASGEGTSGEVMLEGQVSE